MVLTKKEEKIYKSIYVASENNPLKPEFPADNPKFPATPTFEFNVPGIKNVWIKDESVNPTGTHKDRMAWEIIVTYKEFLEAKKRGQINKPLPAMSLITSGSAGIAIQSMLKKYNLPNLKVVIDKDLNENIKEQLHKIKCQVYETDLSLKRLDWKEVLRITENSDGLDITSNEALGPTSRFYDWMAYEVINSSPDYCFIPFGSGNLYENIINVNRKEILAQIHDPRFKGNVKTLRDCNFIGAGTNNPLTMAQKLYSPHLPFVHYDEQWIKTYRRAGVVGEESKVKLIKESLLRQALEIAQDNNVTTSPSGISGLAILLQMKNKIQKNKKILIVNTGKTHI